MAVRPLHTKHLRWLLLSLLISWSSAAFGWVETVVRSHQARVIVARDGSAEVRHELVVKLRGGPLESLDVAGLGVAIEPLSDASVSRADQGTALISPLQITPTGDGGLRLGILMERGLRGGSYLFRFAYELSLREAGWLEPDGEGWRLRFVGPRLPTGVDAAHVTFVVPRASTEPRLPENARGPAAGILLSQIRRGVDSDEVELVRAHLATGEPAVWEIVVDRAALISANDPLMPEMGGPVPVVERALGSRGVSLWWLAAAVASASAYGLLAWLKARAAVAAAELAGARVRALLPGGPAARSVLAGLALGGSVLLVIGHQPIGAAVVACVALLATTHLLPVRAPIVRGPGTWKKLEPQAAPRARVLPGRVFDPSTFLGFTAFAALWVGLLAAAYRLLAVSTYASLMVALGALLFVPLFWTGRHGDLPETPWVQGRRWLGFLQKRIEPGLGQVELWGRCADAWAISEPDLATPVPDEVRVRLVLNEPRAGLRAFEVALEEGAGSFIMPCVVLRVLEDSEAAQGLPRDLSWVRGRSPEEKVALVRPAVPTPRALLRLLRSLSRNLERNASDGDSSRKPSRQRQAHSRSGPTAPLPAL